MDVEKSMNALKRQVSCVEFDPSILFKTKENSGDANNHNGINESKDLDLSSFSSISNHDGEMIEDQSRLQKITNKYKRVLIKIGTSCRNLIALRVRLTP